VKAAWQIASWTAAIALGVIGGGLLGGWITSLFLPRPLSSAQMAPMAGVDALVGLMLSLVVYLLVSAVVIVAASSGNRLAFLREKHIHRFWFEALLFALITAVIVPLCIYLI
jgi:hypothetical protein